MPNVPLELTDYIIDFLHEDARTLASCAVVSRAWIPAARFHLFRSIVLRDDAFSSSFRRLLTLSPDLGYYVRDLTVARSVTVSEVFLPSKPAGPCINNALPQVLQQLPHLRSLTLAHVDLKNIANLSSLHHPALSSLSLSYCQFADFADLTLTAHLLSHLFFAAIGLPVTMSLAGCAALESLRLQFPIHYSTTLPWVTALLATIDAEPGAAFPSAARPASAAVRTLAFDIRLLGSVDALDWAGLNHVLATSPSYRALDALCVGVNLWPGVHKTVAAVERIVRERLALLEQKGVLRFCKS
ncbi:hypothetical protein BN946_scf185007.g267 [Trametes cinnabarina]|uniref:F-box domain-containing protein n=1 Tax=Pycnoporus cinnabarinus TaxID=5643 RepID=A0A060SFC4_PYCCI|nr:hypothetical protein BN946_scf185007.g267 [Trametes cinnabarina]